MIINPLPNNEDERLKRLEFFNLIDLGKDPELDVFAEGACLIADCPASLVAMMERQTQTIQSCIGLSLDYVDRKNTICQYVISSGEIVVINDTLLDERSSSNPLILEGGIRFYAGIPLIDEDGYALGTLCVIDFKPKVLSEKQILSLTKMGAAITKIITGRKKNIQAEYFEDMFGISNNLIGVLDRNFNLKEANPAFESTFQLSPGEAEKLNFIKVVGEENRELSDIVQNLDLNIMERIINTKTLVGSSEIIINWHLKANFDHSEILCFGRNVTASLAEKIKLERSEQRFKNFFENAIGLMSIHDMEGNIIAVNEKGREVLNYSAEETKNLNLKMLMPERNWPYLQVYLDRVAANKEDLGTMKLKTKDGEEIVWMYHNLLEIDDDGKPYVISTALNVTDRVLLEKDLLQTKKMLEQTNKVAKVGGWEINMETNTLFWSSSTKEIHKVDQSYEPELETAINFYSEEFREKMKSVFKHAYEEGISFDEELQLRQSDGNIIWVRAIGIPEMEGGKVVKVFGILQNIDEFKNTYLDLAQKEAMLQSFVHYVPASVAMFDRNLNYLSVSAAWAKEFSVNEEEIMGKHIFYVSPNVPAERARIYLEALKGKSYKNENLAVEIVNKGLQHYSLEVRPWYISEGIIGGVIVSIQNISGTVKINEELKKAKDRADLASKAKSEFLANMSHEIRTPLNGVIGFSDLLLKTPLNDMQKQYLNYINESGESLLNIINDILDFSKIESGKMDLFIDKSNIYDLVSQVVNVILYQSQRKNIELLLNIEPGLPKTILLDESRIKQVLINLLGNAVKFTETGEIELKVQKLRMDDKMIKLRFAVRDTGIGIPSDKQQRIFDAFTQEDSSVSKKFGGTGLGLTISNNILKYMRSQLTLESEPEKGSVFYFDIEIPYEINDEDNFKDDEDFSKIKKVLVVDDNENNRIILQHMLVYKNIEATLAANGMEALQILMKGDRFDVILMDYHMPVISGLETIEKIKELFNKQHEVSPLVVLHTSSEEHDVINRFRQDEKSFCLLKPIKSEELYSILKRAIHENVPAETAEAEIVENISTDSPFKSALQVLLVDDNPVNMVLNNKMMHSLIPDAVLTEKEDGAKALKACQERHFDLILMDVQMPVMDGIEATKQIRLLEGFAEVPIIGVTAGNVLGEKEKCLAAGMTDFLPKPLRQADLLEILTKNILRNKKDKKELISPEQHLDLDLLNEQVGEDEEFRKMFLNLVVKELSTSRELLFAASQERNAEISKTLLHKLRGTAGTAGLLTLAETAKTWEHKINTEPDFSLMKHEIDDEINIGLYLIGKLII